MWTIQNLFEKNVFLVAVCTLQLHFVFMISSVNDRYGWFKCDFFIIVICSTRKRVRFICIRHENEMRTSPWIWFNYSNLTSYRKVMCWMFEYWVFIMWISNRRYSPVANQFHRNSQHQHLPMKLMLHSKRNSSIRNQSKPIRIYIFITAEEPFYLFALIQLMDNSRALWWRTNHPFSHVNEENVEVDEGFSAGYQGLF